MDLTLVAADIQEKIIFLDSVDEVEPMSERELRQALRAGAWTSQRTNLPY